MEFDERLQHAFDALTDRLHQEVVAQLNTARADLAGSVQVEREAAVSEARRGARAAAEQELTERLKADVARSGAEVRAEATALQTAATDRLVEAIRAIDAAGTLSDILDALVGSALAEVGRVAIFLPQGSTLKGWRLAGFDRPAVDGSDIELAFADGGMIAEAGETGRLIRLDRAGSRDTLLPSFAGLPENSRALAVPLVMTDQVFAVLYADEGLGEPPPHASWMSTLEVLARHAARALEAITATKLAQIAEITV